MLTALVNGLAAAACCRPDAYTGPGYTLRIASGTAGGVYIQFARLLANEITLTAPRLHTVVVQTGGSVENLRLLSEGNVDIALTAGDAALACQTPSGPLHTPLPLSAIGRVYEDYVQLVVLAESPLHVFTDLAGHAISLGTHGSALELLGNRLLAATGLSTTAVAVTHLTPEEAINALERGQVAALLWSGGIPTPALAALATRRPIRLLPLDNLISTLRATYGPIYDPTTVRANTYGSSPAAPTIGLPNLLVCRPNADPALTAAVTRVLLSDAPRLVPNQAHGAQFLDPTNLIVTAGIPLHPGAVTAYREQHD